MESPAKELANRKVLLVIAVFLLSASALSNFLKAKNPSLNALALLPASRLLKTADDPTVYYVNQNRLKLAIPSAEVFLSYGARWQDIEVVEKPELDFYKAAEYIKLIGNGRLYQLKDGVKRYLTPKAATALRILPEDVIWVNKTEFKIYKSGQTFDEQEALALRAQKDSVALLETQSQKCVPDARLGGADGCKIFEAMEKRDAAVCDSITNEEWKAKCYGAVLPESGDYAANCRKLSNPDLKNGCVTQVVLVKNSPDLCSQIADNTQKKFCLASLSLMKKDINACDNLPEGDGGKAKNVCLYSYAAINSDSRACDKIAAGSAYKQSCLNFINQRISVLKNFKSQFLTSGAEKILTFIFGKQAQAQISNSANIPVGGRFLPGAFDIFTPTVPPVIPSPCLLVSVGGPNPGLFNFIPIAIYDYFPVAFYHVGLNMLGLAKFVPGSPCPPNLFMLGSGASQL